MEKYVLRTFYLLLLSHHLYTSKISQEIDYNKSPDPRVVEIKQFSFRYFTSWNMIIQQIYAVVAILAAILHFLPKRFHKYEHKILILKGYIFTTFVFPITLFVSGMFWSLYFINREWVLPATADLILPNWLNHSIHTVILIPIVVETIVAKQTTPSFKSAFIGLSTLLLMYNIIFFYTYYECGRWLYGLFYILSWHERIVFMIINYLITLIIMKIGFNLQYFKRNAFPNFWVKLSKTT